MSVFDVVAWMMHALAVWWAWPWLRSGKPSKWLVALSCALPIIAWCWLIPEGFEARSRQEMELRRQVRAAERRKAIAFLREQLASGTPVEQMNAREVLALWNVPEVAPVRSAASTDPLILHTSRPESVQQPGPWLVVGGTARAHVDPPSLQRYAAGCRCPACVGLWNDVNQARRGGGNAQEMWVFQDAIAQANERIMAGLSIPRVSHESSMMDCPDCDVQEVHQMNGRGDICVTHVVGRTCSAHGGVSINWQHGHSI